MSYAFQVKYVGNQTRLYGKTALVQIDRQDPTRCKAQFDDTKLPEAFGWTPFLTNEFDFRPSQLQEFWDIQGRNQ